MKPFKLHFHRLGCDWQIVYFASKEILFLEDKLLRMIDSYCDVFSRFDSNSMLSQLNEKRELMVSDQFLMLWDQSVYFYKKTGGCFNPLASPAHIGYRESFEKKSQEFVSSKLIDLDFSKIEKNGNVLKLKPGQLLDFGGFGKGYLVDQIVVWLRGISNHFYVNAGGDISVFGGKPDGSPWNIGMDDPRSDDLNLVLHLHTGSVATSGTSKRFWGQDKHHILDVEKKDSAHNEILSATILSSPCVLADVLATVSIATNKAKVYEIFSNFNVEFAFLSGDKWVFSKNFRKYLA